MVAQTHPRLANAGALVLFAALALSLPATPAHAVGLAEEPAPVATPAAGMAGGPGLAILAKKIVTAEYGGRAVVDNGVLLVKDGRIEAVGTRRATETPEGYETLDLGAAWISPGMIELHCHVACNFFQDHSETVFLTNPGMRASSMIVPEYVHLRNAVAGGVTTALHIPGSATNMGGQGVLLRTGGRTYEEMLIRSPGSLKLAQAGNPERIGPWFAGRSFMNYNTRSTFRRGISYAKRRLAAEEGEGPPVERDLQFDVFPELIAGRTQVSTHTQIYQVVLMTLEMVRKDFGLPVYIDHGTFDGFVAAKMANDLDVPAILGPRQISRAYNFPGFSTIDHDGKLFGVAAEYQKRGHKKVGFNTDAVSFMGPGGPSQEELGLQAAMGTRYGFDNSEADAVRGVTIVPAMAAGIDDQLGSLEVGKVADMIVTTGDPNDPRCSVEMVFMNGERIYDTNVDMRRY